MNQHTQLEQQIAAALRTDDCTAAELAELLAETTAAITAADTAAIAERERALDPALCADPTAARAAAEDAIITAGRLNTLRSRLEAKLGDRQQTERLDEWLDDFLTVESARDSLVGELLEVPEVLAKLVDLFGRLKANDAEITRLHLRRPANISEHLLGAELTARGLDSFAGHRSIIDRIALFDFDGTQVWPPSQTAIDPTAYTPPPSIAYSDRWAEAIPERQRQRAAEQQRVDKFYADQQDEREARETEERRSVHAGR